MPGSYHLVLNGLDRCLQQRRANVSSASREKPSSERDRERNRPNITNIVSRRISFWCLGCLAAERSQSNLLFAVRVQASETEAKWHGYLAYLSSRNKRSPVAETSQCSSSMR